MTDDRPLRPGFVDVVIGWFGALALRTLGATWRVRVDGVDTISNGGLGASWHRNLLVGTWFFRSRGIAMCISRSRDGDRVAAALRYLDYADPLRGSTSRGGVGVARQVLKRLANGNSVGVLADGPRGPAGRSKPGVVGLARVSGVSITPVALSARPGVRLRSWDRALLPLPFARVDCCFGDPIPVPADASPVVREEIRRKLDRELDRLTAAAEARLRSAGSGAETPACVGRGSSGGMV